VWGENGGTPPPEKPQKHRLPETRGEQKKKKSRKARGRPNEQKGRMARWPQRGGAKKKKTSMGKKKPKPPKKKMIQTQGKNKNQRTKKKPKTGPNVDEVFFCVQVFFLPVGEKRKKHTPRDLGKGEKGKK